MEPEGSLPCSQQLTYPYYRAHNSSHIPITVLTTAHISLLPCSQQLTYPYYRAHNSPHIPITVLTKAHISPLPCSQQPTYPHYRAHNSPHIPITVLTTAHISPLPCSQQPTNPHPICLGSTLLLFSHLRLGLRSGIFPAFYGTASQRDNQSVALSKAWHLFQVSRKRDIQYPCLNQHSFEQGEVESCFIEVRNWVFCFNGRRKALWQEYLSLKFTRYYKGNYVKKKTYSILKLLYGRIILRWIWEITF